MLIIILFFFVLPYLLLLSPILAFARFPTSKKLDRSTYLLFAIVAFFTAFIYNFNSTSIGWLVYNTAPYSIYFFFILLFGKKLYNYISLKDWRQTLRVLIIFIVYVIVGYFAVTTLLSMRVCPSMLQPSHWRTNRFTGKCNFGGAASCLIGDPWYYEYGCEGKINPY